MNSAIMNNGGVDLRQTAAGGVSFGGYVGGDASLQQRASPNAMRPIPPTSLSVPALPASVKVGYQRFRIVEMGERESSGKNRYGECIHTQSMLRVALGFGYVKAANTLLHEIMHVVWSAGGLQDGDNEERCVEALSNGLSAVFLDNPDVLAWIEAGLRSGDN